MAKPQFKQFYINQGKEQHRLKQGVLRYYEMSLRELYNSANNDNLIDYERIRDIKNKIDSYREKEVEGIKIRSRIQDFICGENISRYLIAKQKEIAQKKLITKLKNNDGSVLSSFIAIRKHALKFYRNLYSKYACDNDKQLYFLSFLHDGLSDDDRNMLCAAITKDEIYKVLKSMALNKTPGLDGLPG